jgi:ribonuclease P protein component
MSKLWKRLTSEEFQQIFDKGCFVSGKSMILCISANQNFPSVGFTLKKSKRTIVARNYLKRKLKEAFLMVQFFLPVQWHIVLIGNDSIHSMTIEQISEEIVFLSDVYKRKFLEYTIQTASS